MTIGSNCCFGWLGALALLVACGDGPRVQPLGAGDVILALGDSLTYGTGVDDSDSYPSVLAELTGLSVVNAGIPGEVTARGLARLPGLLEEHAPRLVVLCHGGNDLLRRVPRSQTRENLRAMIEMIRGSGADVVMLGVPAPGIFLSSAELYVELATELSVPIDADVLPRLEGQRDLKSDRVHLNRAGYRRMAEAVYALLKDGGALLMRSTGE